MQSNAIRDEGVSALADALATNNALQELAMGWTDDITDVGATALAEAGELLTSFGVTIDRLSGDEWDWDPSLSSAFATCPNDPTGSVEVDFDAIYDRLQRSSEP